MTKTTAQLNTEPTNADIAEGMVENAEAEIKGADIETVKEMAKAGVMYGHKKSRTNPRFSQYIFTTRNGMEIIDLVKTLPAINAAADFLADQIKNNKIVLLVGIQPASWEAIETLAKKFNLPYVKNRWIGGTITNFKVINARVEHFKKTQASMEKGEFEKYTKKERVMINKDISRMKQMFGGLENLTKIPDVLLTIDPSLKGHATAIREAKRVKIPVVAIMDSDDNPDLIDYPIPANDHAKTSVEWIVNKIISKF